MTQFYFTFKLGWYDNAQWSRLQFVGPPRLARQSCQQGGEVMLPQMTPQKLRKEKGMIKMEFPLFSDNLWAAIIDCEKKQRHDFFQRALFPRGPIWWVRRLRIVSCYACHLMAQHFYCAGCSSRAPSLEGYATLTIFFLFRSAVCWSLLWVSWNADFLKLMLGWPLLFGCLWCIRSFIKILQL